MLLFILICRILNIKKNCKKKKIEKKKERKMLSVTSSQVQFAEKVKSSGILLVFGPT